MKSVKVVIVAEDLLVIRALRDILCKCEYSISAVASCSKETAESELPRSADVILFDIDPGIKSECLALALHIRSRFPIPLIYLLPSVTEDLLQQADITSPSSFILKPLELKDVHSTIEMTLERHTAKSSVPRPYDELPVPYQSLDKDGCVLDINSAWVKTTGYGRDEVIGKWFGDFLVPQEKDLFKERFELCWASREVFHAEFSVIRKDGRVINISFDGKVSYDENGAFKQSHCISTNIPSLRVMEAEVSRLASFLERNPNPVMEITAQGTVGYLNPKAKKLFPDIAARVFSHPYLKDIQHLFSWFPEQAQTTYVQEAGAGEAVYLQTLFYVVEEKTIRIYGVDITEHQRAKDALRESTFRYQELFGQQKAILDNISDMAWLKDSESRFIAVNESFIHICGFKKEEIIGKRDIDIWPKEIAERHRCDDQEVMRSGKRKQIDEQLVGKDGKIQWIETIKTPIFDEKERVIGTAAIARDITERKQAEGKIQAYQKQLLHMANEIALTEERQRRHIAEGLHDDVCQTLSLVCMELSKMKEAMIGSCFPEQVEVIHIQIKECLEKIRSLIFELTPPLLDEDDFVSTIEWLAEHIHKQSGLHVRCINDGRPKPIQTEMIVFMYGAVRELLINIIKHARAKNGLIRMSRDGDFLCVQVNDDGDGFDTGILSVYNPKGGYGLFNIRERIQHYGGSLVVESARGKGVMVTLRMPLHQVKKPMTKQKGET